MENFQPMGLCIRWIHNKTGNLYILLGTAINATNGHDNKIMMLYQRIDNLNHPQTYVRESDEFYQKFTPYID